MLPFSFLSFVGGIRGALSIAATLALCWNLHSLSQKWMKKSHERELQNLEATLRGECVDSLKKAEELTNESIKKIKTINTRHADAIGRLLQHEAAKCSCSGVDDGAANSDAFHRAAGILDLGRAAEENTEKLIMCQKFVKDNL